MSNAFISPIICISKQWSPSFWQLFRIHSISMILTCNVTASSALVNTRLVMSTVSIFHFVCRATRRKSQKLVTQTNSKNGFNFWLLQKFLQVFNCLLAHFRISRTITDEKTIVFGVVIKVVIPRNHLDLHVTFEEATKLIVFHTAVNNAYFVWTVFVC